MKSVKSNSQMKLQIQDSLNYQKISTPTRPKDKRCLKGARSRYFRQLIFVLFC